WGLRPSMSWRSVPFDAFKDSVFAPLPHATARAVQVHASIAIAAIRMLPARIGMWIRTGGVYRQGGRRSQVVGATRTCVFRRRSDVGGWMLERRSQSAGLRSQVVGAT